MQTDEWLCNVTQKLKLARIATARLDCLVLLEDATGKDRSWLLAHPEYALEGAVLKRMNTQIEQRAKHEPLAYIRGKSEFYGREFRVTPDTLEPRPETETMIKLALEVIGSRLEVAVEPICIVDVGTGSGALGITMKLEVSNSRVILTDISAKCLTVAKRNAQKYNINVRFLRGDLLEPLYNLKPLTFNILLANLPYVPDSHTINQAAMFEPKIAIFGGPDGLDLYRRLFEQIAELSNKPRYVFTESLPFQHEVLAKIAKRADYKLLKSADFIQIFESFKRP